MKRPGWLRGGANTDAESHDEGGKGSGDRESTAPTSSERAQRERLARARRERALRARADLAAKAKAEGGKATELNSKTEREPRRPGRNREERPGGKPRRGATGSRRDRSMGIRKSVGVALKQGAGETQKRAQKAAPGLAKRALAILVVVFGVFFDLLAFVLNVAIAIGRFLIGPVRTALSRARQVLDAASRALTPARALTLAVAGGIVLLAVSQFSDYRSIAIGNDNYAGDIQTVAPAPEVDRKEAGSAHSYVLVPIAVLCLPLLLLALRGRWRLCRVIALAGAAAIVVGLVIDRPAGLDVGERALAYQDARASLLGGFYAQLFAGLLLVASSLMLSRELRLAGAVKPVRSTHSSQARRRLRRRDPSAEGAGA